jgi:hypothetical protein
MATTKKKSAKKTVQKKSTAKKTPTKKGTAAARSESSKKGWVTRRKNAKK